MFYYDSSYFLFMIITFPITMYAHFKVRFIFNKYSKIKCDPRLNGAKSAGIVLYENSISDVEIVRIHGSFNDHFDPTKNKISLSKSVYLENSITAVGVAAHEAGHAAQYASGYGFMKIRQRLVPITQICSGLSMPVLLIGLLLPLQYNFVVNLGIILFAVAVLFQFVTLPVEFDASRRAISSLKNSNRISEKEIYGVRKVLNAAALTYVASLFTSLIYFLRLILISSKRKD
ncbi:MAG: zinc metallopeptidase [Oscillospiraceae bacterium]|jgi:Zn-dependent membrane protease YugP|nr:zinc metallopeptidase [Oscillospiraceae bacterium]